MANDCCFKMKLVGDKKDRDAWLKKMESYDEDNHFHRIFWTEVYDEDEEATYIAGDCAWSVESCCRSGYTGGVDLLEKNSKDLNLTVEIWTTEPGMGFQEHYIYDKGECEEDECVDYSEHYWDRTDYPEFADYVNEWWGEECPYVEEDFDEDGYMEEGGFSNYGAWHI